MHGRAEALIRQESQRVAHVDDGTSRFGGHALPRVGGGGQDLEPGLFGEEKSQGSGVGVDVLPLAVFAVGGGMVEEI